MCEEVRGVAGAEMGCFLTREEAVRWTEISGYENGAGAAG